MSFNRYFDLIVNLGAGSRGPLLRGVVSLTPAATPVWTQNDKLRLRVWFVTPAAIDAAAPTVTALAAGAAIALGARPATDLDEAGLLFSATGFVEVGEGAELHYEAELNLNTQALAVAMAGRARLAVKVDIEIQDAGNTARITVPQFDAIILRDVFRGTEGIPESGDLPYPAPAQIVLRQQNGSPLQVGSDGTPYLFNPQTQQYHRLALQGIAGAVVVVADQEGVNLIP